MSQDSVALRSISSFFVGGSSTVVRGLPASQRSMVLNGAPRSVDPNGTHVHGQMYVQEFRLAAPRHRDPVVLWHGGGMTGTTWESTPDGRPGWLWRFLAAGFDVLVCDAVERGRSSWAMFPQIYREEPVFRTKEEAWHFFRLGPAYSNDAGRRQVFEGQRFPVHAFDEFAKQWVPRWPGHEQMALAAYEELVRRLGRCLLVSHSQGGGYAAEIARRLPASVARVVAVEPGGMPTLPPPNAALPPHLVIWGDFIAASGSHWTGYRQQAENYLSSISDQAIVAVDDLPANGIRGNSHFPMMDDNSDAVFQRVHDWLVDTQPSRLRMNQR